jgi:zona occludens toxin (predicted ATPase)
LQYNIFGKPGDGKSYSVVFFILLFAIAAKRRVVANIVGLNPVEITSYLNYLVTADVKTLDRTERKLLLVLRENGTDTGDFDFLPYIKVVDEEDVKRTDFWYSPDFPDTSITQPGDVIAIDEARRYFGTGVKVTERCIMCILKHRHYVDALGRSMDLYFIAQQPGHLNREVSGNAQFTRVARRMLRAGSHKVNKFRLDYYEGAAGLTEIKRGEAYDGVEETLNKRIFKLYKSFEGATGFESSSRLPTVWDTKFWFGLSLFKFWLPFFGVLFLWGAYALYDFYKHPPMVTSVQGATSKPGSGAITRVSAATPLPSGVRPPGAPPGLPVVATLPPVPMESPDFRLVGFYTQAGIRYAILSDVNNRLRYVKDFKDGQNALSPEIVWNGRIISYWSGVVASIPQLSKADKSTFQK